MKVVAAIENVNNDAEYKQGTVHHDDGKPEVEVKQITSPTHKTAGSTPAKVESQDAEPNANELPAQREVIDVSDGMCDNEAEDESGMY